MEVMWRLILAAALLCLTAEAQIRCKDKDNKDVDWYILYKLPKSFKYFYMDPSKEDDKLSDKINHQTSPLANTLEPYFNKEPGYIAYNDQLPTCNALDEYGHSKGFVMTDKTSGFWLLHSTPKFPSGTASNNFYPSSGERNAQTFICVTFKYDTFKDIGKHLQYIKAHVFQHNVPKTFYKELQEAANGDTADPNKLSVLHQDLESERGQTFRSFVKKQLKGSRKRQHNADEEDGEDEEDDPCANSADELKNAKDGDLYVFIAENIKSNVYVQHWGNQRGRSGDYKPNTGNYVLNVECIKTDNVEPWTPSKDHSKWCVSEDKNWTCFGDSNRSLTQYKRRGGALCIKDTRVTQKFNSFIKQKNDCPDNTNKNNNKKRKNK